MLIQELNALLHAPHAAGDDADDVLCNFVFSFLGFLLQVYQHGTNRFHDGDYQRAKRCSAQMVTSGSFESL